MSEPGSQRLANTRHEIYAQSRAKGMKQGDAWKTTVPFGTPYKGGGVSLRVSGNRVEARPEVRARINYLIRESRRAAVVEVPETLTRADIMGLSLEVTEALEAAYSAAVQSTASAQQIERLKGVWAAHLARQGKLEEAREPLPENHEKETAAIMARIRAMGNCSCLATR